MTVANGNEVSLTFQKYVRMTKHPIIVQNLLNKYDSLTNSNVININEIIMYDQSYDYHG